LNGHVEQAHPNGASIHDVEAAEQTLERALLVVSRVTPDLRDGAREARGFARELDIVEAAE